MANTVNFPELLYPGLNGIFGDSYPEYAPEWEDAFGAPKPSKQAYEKSLGMTGFGLASIKDEGHAVDYDDPMQGPTHSVYHFVRALGFIVTEEMYDDDQYNKINSLPKLLKKSMLQTKEWDHANIFNNAFASGTGADGVYLIATNHPLLMGGTWSNAPTTMSDLSLTALEQADIDIQNFVDDRGLKMHLQMKKLIHTTSDDWTARILLGSDKDPETPASNAINIAKTKGLFREGHMAYHSLTDPDAWFITTDAERGLISYKRRPLNFRKDNDFGSGNGLYKADERYSVTWDDPRGIYGSSGG